MREPALGPQRGLVPIPSATGETAAPLGCIELRGCSATLQPAIRALHPCNNRGEERWLRGVAVTDVSSILCSRKASGFGTEVLLWHPSSPAVHWVTSPGAEVGATGASQPSLLLPHHCGSPPGLGLPQEQRANPGGMANYHVPNPSPVSHLQPGPPACPLPAQQGHGGKRDTDQIQCPWCCQPAPSVTAQPRRELFRFQGHGPCLLWDRVGLWPKCRGGPVLGWGDAVRSHRSGAGWGRAGLQLLSRATARGTT